jgi:hypothetical protein
VRDRGVAAEDGQEVGGAGGVHVRGEADVAVVEPDDEVTTAGEAGAELVRPADL